VIFFQRPVRAVCIILEISFFTSGKSDNLGGVNSTLAYFTKVCKLGLAVAMNAVQYVRICFYNNYFILYNWDSVKELLILTAN